MNIDRIDIPQGTPSLGPDPTKARTPKEAAQQFEQILVKQMMKEMTKSMFESKLSGEDGPQWLGAYSDMQSDVLATELAKQMSESGQLGIADLLMKQWSRQAEAAETLDALNTHAPDQPEELK